VRVFGARRQPTIPRAIKVSGQNRTTKRRPNMSTNNNNQKVIDDVHPHLEKMLIETYLKGKGYDREELKSMPKAVVRQLLTEASTYASGKLAEMEGKAHLMRELHDAYIGE
jgi:hypothetical protein